MSGRWPAAPARGIIDAVGKAPSVSEGAFLRLLGTVSVFMRRARRFPAGPAFPWVSLKADAFLGSRETLGVWLISQCFQGKWFKYRPYWYN